MLCLTSKMSHDLTWREPCSSTDRDKSGRWLWRLVRQCRQEGNGEVKKRVVPFEYSTLRDLFAEATSENLNRAKRTRRVSAAPREHFKTHLRSRCGMCDLFGDS